MTNSNEVRFLRANEESSKPVGNAKRYKEEEEEEVQKVKWVVDEVREMREVMEVMATSFVG